MDYLQLDPSVDLRQRAPDGVQADLSIRGSTFGQTLVLLNGLRMKDAQTGHYNLDLPLPTDSIRAHRDIARRGLNLLWLGRHGRG